MKTPVIKKTLRMLQTTMRKRFDEDDIMRVRMVYRLQHPVFFHVNRNNVSCSCIIGQKNGNMVRYLEFLENNDPIVSISGPNAIELKPGLEKKF